MDCLNGREFMCLTATKNHSSVPHAFQRKFRCDYCNSLLSGLYLTWYDISGAIPQHYGFFYLFIIFFYFSLFFLLFFTFSRNLWMWEVLKNGPKYLLAPGHPFLLQNWEENILKIWAPTEDLSLLVSLLLPTTSSHKHKYSRSKYFVVHLQSCILRKTSTQTMKCFI